jgi:hypothetical protein
MHHSVSVALIDRVVLWVFFVGVPGRQNNTFGVAKQQMRAMWQNNEATDRNNQPRKRRASNAGPADVPSFAVPGRQNNTLGVAKQQICAIWLNDEAPDRNNQPRKRRHVLCGVPGHNKYARCDETRKLQMQQSTTETSARATPDRRMYQVLLFRTNTRASRTEVMSKEKAVAYCRG